LGDSGTFGQLILTELLQLADDANLFANGYLNRLPGTSEIAFSICDDSHEL